MTNGWFSICANIKQDNYQIIQQGMSQCPQSLITSRPPLNKEFMTSHTNFPPIAKSTSCSPSPGSSPILTSLMRARGGRRNVWSDSHIRGIPDKRSGDPSSSLWNSTKVQYPSCDDNAKYLPFGDLSTANDAANS